MGREEWREADREGESRREESGWSEQVENDGRKSDYDLNWIVMTDQANTSCVARVAECCCLSGCRRSPPQHTRAHAHTHLSVYLHVKTRRHEHIKQQATESLLTYCVVASFIELDRMTGIV